MNALLDYGSSSSSDSEQEQEENELCVYCSRYFISKNKWYGMYHFEILIPVYLLQNKQR